MNVICDRCSTEYEFEEALVSTRGTTVKCTHCGHLFKVFRSEVSALSSSHSGTPMPGTCWTVRRIDGSSREWSTLAELMQAISQGRLTRDDEVSRTGKAWRRLGAVEELEPFFIEADRRGPSRLREAEQALAGANDYIDDKTAPQRPSASLAAKLSPETDADTELEPDTTVLDRGDAQPTQTLRLELSGLRPAPPSAADAAHGTPNSAVPAKSTGTERDEDEIKTQQRDLPRRRRLSSAYMVRPPLESPQPTVRPALANKVVAARGRSSSPPMAAARTPGPVTFPVRPRDHEGGRESWTVDPKPAPHKRGWLWLTAGGVTVAALGLFYVPPLASPQPAVTQAPTEDPGNQFLQRAEAGLASHRLDRFEDAKNDYIRLQAFREHDPVVLAALSRLHAIWAQELTFDLDAHQAQPDQDVERRSEWLMRANQARTLALQAKQYAEAARRILPDNPDIGLVLSDALRLVGDVPGARMAFNRSARAATGAEGLRVAALLAAAEAKNDLRAGRDLAAQAVAKDRQLLRTHLLLARCLVAANEADAARAQLQLVRIQAPDHPGARAVEELLTRPAEPVVRVETAPTKAPAPETASANPSADNLSHEAYISRAQSLLETGQITAAKRHFEQALFVRPNSNQAHTGLGYVALEKNRPQLAIEHFTAAMRSGNDDALIGLGDAYRRVGRNREALRAYQNYLSRKPNGDQVSIARAQVDRLGDELGLARKSP
jgi:predicted Zn finger-like uncharacterized protein